MFWGKGCRIPHFLAMVKDPLFRDRTQAGKLLAQAIYDTLTRIATKGVKSVPIVCALPRGGLPVAAPIAHLLSCPLTIEVAKKNYPSSKPRIGGWCSHSQRKCSLGRSKISVSVTQFVVARSRHYIQLSNKRRL